MDGALQATLDYATTLQRAIRIFSAAGATVGGRVLGSWTAALGAEEAWRGLAAAMAEQRARVALLQGLLGEAGAKSVLRELELQLDFNGYHHAKAAAAAVAGGGGGAR